MSDELIILLEWLNANGITELFNEIPSNVLESKTDKHIIEVSDNKNFQHVIQKLADKNRDIVRTGIDQIDSIAKVKNTCDLLDSVDLLKDFVNTFGGFDRLRQLSNNTIFFDGNIEGKILIINEVPDEIDDEEGKVFSGDTGVLLEKMLRAIAVSIEDCCFVNTFFWRLAGNRAPIKEELSLCKPIVEKFISIVKPELIIFTGSYGINTFTGLNGSIVKIHGKFFDYTNEYMYNNIKATAIYNPSFLIKNPIKKREAWIDLQEVQRYLQE